MTLEIVHFPMPPRGDRPEPAREPYPAPLFTSEMPTDRPISQPARKLLAAAEGFGWAGRITQAEGFVPHAAYGTPGKAAKYSEAVRLARGEQRAVAVRRGGSWDSLWTWSTTQFFRRHGTLEAFEEALI